MSYTNQTNLMQDLTYELHHKSSENAVVCLLETSQMETLKTDVKQMVDVLYEEGILRMPLSHQKYVYLDNVADYSNMVYLDMYIEYMNKRANSYDGVLIIDIAQEMKDADVIANLKLLIRYQKAQLIFMLSEDSLQAFDSLGTIHATMDHLDETVRTMN